MTASIDALANSLMLGPLLALIKGRYGGYEIVAHWQQGEFHHDVVLRLSPTPVDLPGPVLVVSMNCNGGVKEILAFDAVPDRGALWEHRCPPPGAAPTVLPILASSRTVHWFDPCELLGENARSELLPEFRQRQEGGGWQMVEGAGGCRGRRPMSS